MIRINFSGHPVKGFELAPLVGVNSPYDAEGAHALVCRVLDELPREVQVQLFQGGAAEVVLPGMAWLAGLLLAEWHGRYGHFPVIRWAVRDPEHGFTWPDSSRIDLAEVRLEARARRSEGAA